MRALTATVVNSKAPITAALRIVFDDASVRLVRPKTWIEVPSMTLPPSIEDRCVGLLHQMGSTALGIE
jgi:hypothetical protein